MPYQQRESLRSIIGNFQVFACLQNILNHVANLNVYFRFPYQLYTFGRVETQKYRCEPKTHTYLIVCGLSWHHNWDFCNRSIFSVISAQLRQLLDVFMHPNLPTHVAKVKTKQYNVDGTEELYRKLLISLGIVIKCELLQSLLTNLYFTIFPSDSSISCITPWIGSIHHSTIISTPISVVARGVLSSVGRMCVPLLAGSPRYCAGYSTIVSPTGSETVIGQ